MKFVRGWLKANLGAYQNDKEFLVAAHTDIFNSEMS